MKNSPAILSTHAALGLTVTRFATRFGGVVWLITDAALVGRDDHGGTFQGTRKGAVAFLRARQTDLDYERRAAEQRQVDVDWATAGGW